MTCFFDPDGETMDVYDHEATLVAEGVEQTGWGERGVPDEVLDVLYDAREGSQPSAYNQELLFCIAVNRSNKARPRELLNSYQ